MTAPLTSPDPLTTPRASLRPGSCSTLPSILDACCGPRMMWFNKSDQRALFVDKRREELTIETVQGKREIIVDPDVIANFGALPFPDSSFSLVVFDPPHTHAGGEGWMGMKYGKLPPDWRDEISKGFSECFRVLAPFGTLIFKWNEHNIRLSTILTMTPEKPLFGQRCGKTAKTHWVVFHKSNDEPSYGDGGKK
jgi:SAM-dependent methyltransferase